MREITTNLKLLEDGVWVSRDRSEISYPEEGNQACLQIEDSSFWFKHRNDCIVEAMRQFRPAGTILDVGGGNGFVSAAIKQAGMEPLLLEPGRQGIKNARTRGLAPVICSTLHDAGFKPGTVPAAGLFDVLEHIENDLDFLKELREVLVTEGRVFLTVPAYNFLRSDDDDEAGHFRRYTVRSLSDCQRAAGFEVEFATYIFFFLPLPIFLFRTLPSRLFKSKRTKTDKIQLEHGLSSNFVGIILDKLFDFEVRFIRNRKPIPFGGSCLLVARARPRGAASPGPSSRRTPPPAAAGMFG